MAALCTTSFPASSFSLRNQAHQPMAALCSTSSPAQISYVSSSSSVVHARVHARRSRGLCLSSSFCTNHACGRLRQDGARSWSRSRLEVRAEAGEESSSKAQQLWRKELQASDELMTDFAAFDSAAMERDIERLTKKEEVERLLNQAENNDGKEGDQGRGGAIREVADKILMADFFFILFSLAWLVAGLVQQAALESSSLMNVWFSLWPTVFQPALGVFMAGVFVSTLTKKK